MNKTSMVDYFVNDCLSNIEEITYRAMFGGHGIYKDGYIFAIEAWDKIFFKVDDSNRMDFISRDAEQFVYEQGNHKQTKMNYYVLPEDVMEDREELGKWVDKSVEVSKRSKK